MNRSQEIDKLKSGSFDMLIIGGGATGTGTALDAATRGLKVALVERNDFSSGTSSRSTKLIHGGVRYLEQAVLKFDRSQFKLVRDALHERSTLLKIAPHLASPLAILTPLYHRMDVPYYRTGLRLYDRLAGKATLHKSFFVGTKEAMKKFPMLKAERLRGGVVYYDGQFDDARMNITVALTAAREGAGIANHVAVTGLLKTKGRVTGAQVKDQISGDEWEISAKVVINAAGPFLDSILKMEDAKARPLLTASSGTHIVLDAKFSPPETGLLVPKTEDGRVLFLLPWQGHTLVGTTDKPAPIEDSPRPTEADVDYIIRQLKRYFSLKVKKDDIRSAWTGLRPLVSDPRAADTARLSRDHVIHVSDGKLVSIGGGKWTTFRKMALDTVDHAIQVGDLKPKRESATEKLFLLGGKGFSADWAAAFCKKHRLDAEVAHHLTHTYGTEAENVLKGTARLTSRHFYLECEIAHAVQNEAAYHVMDFLARRTRLAFVDSAAAKKLIPSVAEKMGQLLKWDAATLKREISLAQKDLSQFQMV